MNRLTIDKLVHSVPSSFMAGIGVRRGILYGFDIGFNLILEYHKKVGMGFVPWQAPYLNLKEL
ncbi:protein of unknown function [Nitrospina watsonii]|uniref:Uncharacterized protein n=1 Tax=Nitrospina watsonii TaxID=1323948 RepID=A0ABM9HG72_9BACT|nr:protein of unknown function [Nitrospina watsonii]